MYSLRCTAGLGACRAIYRRDRACSARGARGARFAARLPFRILVGACIADERCGCACFTVAAGWAPETATLRIRWLIGARRADLTAALTGIGGEAARAAPQVCNVPALTKVHHKRRSWNPFHEHNDAQAFVQK